jgi:hypothetical protein
LEAGELDRFYLQLIADFSDRLLVRRFCAPSMSNVFADLRAKYFALSRADVSVPAPANVTEPWGAVMEIAYAEATVTTVTSLTALSVCSAVRAVVSSVAVMSLCKTQAERF